MHGLRAICASALIISLLAYYKVTISAAPEQLLREFVIPLGLSYYSFRCLHYVFDRFRQDIPEVTLVQLTGYLFFLPTIVVGPIHRAPDYLENARDNQWTSANISEGLHRIVIGYAKVAVLGNFLLSSQFAQFIGSLEYADKSLVLYLEVLRGGLNLYVQFSGYADIAIGFALLLGYRVIENFEKPFLQPNIAAFWRCWHISLTSWVRDYVYMPALGVTRNPILATFSSFLVIGLWHEISVRYVVWGLYHALGILAWRGLQRVKRKLGLKPIENRIFAAIIHVLSVLLTAHFFLFGLVIIRQPDLTTAAEIIVTILLPWSD